MKNFERQYPINGTSALQPEFECLSARTENIIAFPKRSVRYTARTASAAISQQECSSAVHVMGSYQMRNRILKTEIAQSIRYGSTRGCAYNRVKPWQATIAACVFSILALASIFMGL